MAFKRKASASFECSLSKRVWSWRSGILGVLADTFYRHGTHNPSRSQPNTDAGVVQAVQDGEYEQPTHAGSSGLSIGSPRVQGASESPETDQADVTTSGEPPDTNSWPSSAQDDDNSNDDNSNDDNGNNDGNDDNNENTLNSDVEHPNQILDPSLTVPDSSSIDPNEHVTENIEAPAQELSTWNTSRLRARPSRKVFASRSETTLDAFRESYGCQYTLAQFIGLCAYLSGLLRLGYRICTAQMDGFVHMHATFMREVKRLEQRQRADAEPKLIAYHHWYAQLAKDGGDSRLIMTERTLRSIWAENPFTFLKVQRSLDDAIQARTR